VNPSAPFAPLIRALNEPVLNPIRKILPSLGGLDFSPLLALLLLQVVHRVLSASLPALLML
jgi:YggT family protein